LRSSEFAGWVKKLTGKPTITVGSVGLDNEFLSSFRGENAGTANVDTLTDKLNNREFDLVAVGRALLVDPAWVRWSRIHAPNFRQI
jgi:2,4-dienoyl-CoA reductase-like NADH-dependent reductase (Old Yellow Enzyme family)